MRYRSNTYSSKPRMITAKFASKCCSCGGEIKAGEWCEYFPAKREICHPEVRGDRVKCFSVIKAKQTDPGFVDLDRAYEDQCADICGR